MNPYLHLMICRNFLISYILHRIRIYSGLSTCTVVSRYLDVWIGEFVHWNMFRIYIQASLKSPASIEPESKYSSMHYCDSPWKSQYLGAFVVQVWIKYCVNQTTHSILALKPSWWQQTTVLKVSTEVRIQYSFQL